MVAARLRLQTMSRGAEPRVASRVRVVNVAFVRRQCPACSPPSHLSLFHNVFHSGEHEESFSRRPAWPRWISLTNEAECLVGPRMQTSPDSVENSSAGRKKSKKFAVIRVGVFVLCFEKLLSF